MLGDADVFINSGSIQVATEPFPGNSHATKGCATNLQIQDVKDSSVSELPSLKWIIVII
jgi:hypothetical protein